MATTIKEPPTKDLLERSSIRTMRKDLASLREADSLKEKQKISKIKVEVQEPIRLKPEPAKLMPEKDFSSPKTNEILEDYKKKWEQEDSLSAGLPEKKPQSPVVDKKEESLNAQLKLKVYAYASEAEKQQIFSLESQRTVLEEEMTKLATNTQSPVVLERDNVSLEKENLLKELDDISLEEKANEDELRMMQVKETQGGQVQEKEKAAKNQKKEDIEKRKWALEAKLVKLEDSIKNLDKGHTESQVQKNAIKTKIADVDNSLKAVYESILARKGSASDSKQMPVENVETVVAPTPKPQAVKKPIQIVPEIKEPPLATRPAFAKSSQAAMDKLTKSTEAEEKQRLKFMEDVERWIALSKDGENK